MNIREKRKADHIKGFIKQHKERENYFDYLYFGNNSLPELDFDEIDTGCEFLGKHLDFPLIINAITGGFAKGIEINKDLAQLATKYNIAMAVGSQSISLDGHRKESFEIVRRVMKDQVVIGNLSANKRLEDAEIAVEMLGADAIQLHLNVPQELAMKEGDRHFSGIVDNIKTINDQLGVPVIAKEVGFGISKGTAQKLCDIGVRYIDVSGSGGTDFIHIEDLRDDAIDFRELYSWGIPTPHSIMQCRQASDKLTIIASGGIRNAGDMVKSLCLGADLVGMSGVILSEYMENGYDGADRLISNIIYKFKMIMLMLGCRTLRDLAKVKLLASKEFERASLKKI